MSTRSGKRIHSSFHEDAVKPEVDHVVHSERKTRSRRIKENGEELSASIVKPKKRTNYVAYPTDDEMGGESVSSKKEVDIAARSLRKTALRELNKVTSEVETSELVTEASRPLRTTRRTQKQEEDTENTLENHNHEEKVVGKTKKTGKEKKKKSIEKEAEESKVSKKSKKKMKKGKRSGSMVVEDIEPQEKVSEGLNKSNMSVDSFHSAAGSPVKSTEEDVSDTESQKTEPDLTNINYVKNPAQIPANKPEVTQTRNTRATARISMVAAHQSSPNNTAKKSRKRKSSSNLDKSVTNDHEEFTEFDTTLTNVPKKRKSSIRNNVSTEIKGDETLDKETKNSTFDVDELEKRKSEIKAALVNTTYEKVEEKLDTTFDKNETCDKNTTYDKETSGFKTSTAKKQTPPSKLNSTYEKENNNSQIDLTTEKPAINTTFEKEKSNTTVTRKSEVINTTYEKDCDETDSIQATKTRKSSVINLTYDKDNISSDSVTEIKEVNKSVRKSMSKTQKQSTEINSTFDKNEKSNTTFDKIDKSNTTFDKNEKSDTTFDKNEKPDSTFDKIEKSDTTFDKNEKSDTTFDKDKKLDITFDKVSKSSLISSDTSNVRDSNITLDKSDISRISITSDDSKQENIINTTPVLIESSLDESKINMSKISPKTPTITTKDSLKTPTKLNTSKISPKTPTPVTPLKREGTFTKEGSDLDDSAQKRLLTPTRKMSLPSPGCTPFPVFKSSTKVMNVTRSLEKSRRSSLAEPLPRTTRVMFCSPVNNPVVLMQQRRKVIKSNLKGSNKSFVFEETAEEVRPAPRKRSYTQSDADLAAAKRTRLESTAPPPRALRARTVSAGHAVKPEAFVPRAVTPKKSEGRINRTKLPNFAALHRRQFSKMESLDECQERRARRARLLLTPTGAVTVLERSSPRESPVETERKKSPIPPNEEQAQSSHKSKGKEPQSSKKKDPQTSKKDPQTSKKDQQTSKKDTRSSKKDKDTTSKKEKEAKKPETPVKSLPTLKSLNPGYTRFGFKLNYDVNPFSIPTNPSASLVFSNKKNTIKKDNTKPLKEIKKRHTTLPSSAGVTATSRKEVAKQTVMREKSFTDKRSLIRNENRTVIKGVRTNRRFELQMAMRNID